MRQALFPSDLDPAKTQVEAHYHPTTEQNLEMKALDRQTAENSLATPFVCWIKPYLRPATGGPFCQKSPMNSILFLIH